MPTANPSITEYVRRIAEEISASKRGQVRHRLEIVMRESGMSRRGSRLVAAFEAELARWGIEAVPPIGEASRGSFITFQRRTSPSSPADGKPSSTAHGSGPRPEPAPRRAKSPREAAQVPWTAPQHQWPPTPTEPVVHEPTTTEPSGTAAGEVFAAAQATGVAQPGSVSGSVIPADVSPTTAEQPPATDSPTPPSTAPSGAQWRLGCLALLGCILVSAALAGEVWAWLIILAIAGYAAARSPWGRRAAPVVAATLRRWTSALTEPSPAGTPRPTRAGVLVASGLLATCLCSVLALRPLSHRSASTSQSGAEETALPSGQQLASGLRVAEPSPTRPLGAGPSAVNTPLASSRGTSQPTVQPAASLTATSEPTQPSSPTPRPTNTSPPPTAAPPVDLDPNTDRKCDDFENYQQMEAWRRYWIARGVRNPGGLDGDGDGLACEDGEGGRPPAPPPAEPALGVVSQPQPAQPAPPAPSGCCKYCTPGKSKPCGDSCISIHKTCNKGPGCACGG